MDDKRLEILPWGRTKEQQDKLDTKRAAGQGGVRGCLAQALFVAILIAYCIGWITGKSG